jgi:hypothetical protein
MDKEKNKKQVQKVKKRITVKKTSQHHSDWRINQLLYSNSENKIINSKLETEIISDSPYCRLPDNYFMMADAKIVPMLRARKILTVETWEGRIVMSCESLNS